MARQIRKKSGTGIYHVMLRGINRQDIFEDDEYKDDGSEAPICATNPVFTRIPKDELRELVCTSLEEYGEILDIDNESPQQLSDDDVKAFLLQSQGIANPLMIQSLEKVRRNEILMSAKGFGAGLRQLSRLTGVSFGVIQKL